MASRRRQEEILRFHSFLLQVYEEGKQNNITGPSTFETDLQVHLISEGHTNPLEKLWDQNGVFFIIQKMRSNEESSSLEEGQNGEPSVSEVFPKENLSPSPLALSRARHLISLYTMSQNPNMKHLQISHAVQLPPLWVRCEPSDPKQTIWLGAEPLRSGNSLSGIRLHTINCNGPVSNNNYSIGLEELKENHRMRHHASDLTITGFARYEFLESPSLDSLTQEDSLIPLERNIYADFAWEGVKTMLQTPPLSSAALLALQMTSGSPLSSVYEPNRELQFLLSLAETLKNGVIKWPKALERKSAVELVEKLLKDLKDVVDGQNEDDTEDNTAAVIGSMKTLFSQRGDLDFLELLWCNIWRNVASHEELVKCFSLVIRALQHGELQTWIHQESSSLLSKLIKQSYHGKVETVSLEGDSPVQMLVEIGVDKMKRDYISYFVGKEFAIRTHLDYFMSTSVDLQEQVHRIQKLHHMLEIVDNCLDLIKLEHENLIFLTQSCINYYKENPLNEKHAFQLPVRTCLVKEFYQNAHPQIWRVEISSGQGSKRVKTIWQLSSTPPAEHMQPANGDSLDDTELCGNREKHFITLSECSQVDFI
ncbi:protein zwilch homolog isoform X1 [Ahaetulla prasina]|uniref:protein zwilch homolog isoform X1 n=2 Tax=Ahaetulla prasina TaxID=499056 RepID=UPI0026486FB7|nr:protein zwilch homolog isoform X1 [Ahaetulla prasina]